MIPTKEQIDEMFDEKFANHAQVGDFRGEIKSFIHTIRESDRAETKKTIIDTAYVLASTQIELHHGKLPFVIFGGKADEDEKVSIYRQGIQDFVTHLSKALGITKE